MGNQTSGIKKFTEDDIFYSSLKANKDKVILIRKNLDQLFNNNDKKELIGIRLITVKVCHCIR
jgi:hypothetical protein